MPILPTGQCPTKVMIVGEFPSLQDEAKGFPFADGAGAELDRMLSEAGLSRAQCFVTLTLGQRPPGNDIEAFFAQKKSAITPQHLMLRDKWVLPVVRDGLDLLKREIEMCQPNVIIALGNVALWALTGHWGITSWRGSELVCDLALSLPTPPRVIPTLSPAMVLKQWHLRQVVVHDLRKVAQTRELKTVNPPDYEFLIRPDYGQAVSVLSQLHDQLEAAESPMRLGVDIETRAGQTACIGIAWSETQAICIPLMCVEKPEGYWSEQHEAVIMYAMYKVLTHPKAAVIGQNFSYDAQYFWRGFCFLPRLVRDTMLAQHVMFSNLPKGLDFLSSLYCRYHVYWKDEGKEWNPAVAEDQLWTYNCKDAVITLEVDTAQQAAIDAMKLRAVHDFQQELFWPVLRSMLRGLRVDTSRRAEFALQLQEAIIERQSWLEDLLGHPLNIRSSPQMKELFYGTFAQKPVYNRKTGNVACDDEALRKIAEREPILAPLVRVISELRSLTVFLATFIAAPLDTDGRMRCSFNIAGTETYRFSSSKNAFGSGLNLQNIPKGN